MLIQLTDAGRALLEAQTGPVTITKFKLGDGFNYTPSGSDTNIHGTQVYEQLNTTAPVAAGSNLWRYTCYLDYQVGDFNFGEVGLFTQDGTLFALAAASALIAKTKADGNPVDANAVRIDMYLQIQGENFFLWINPVVSDNRFNLAVLPSVDALPPPSMAIPNAYTIQSTSQKEAFLAYTDTARVWSFADYSKQKTVSVVSSTATSITIDRADFDDWMIPQYYGYVIFQVMQAGQLKLEGTVRAVTTAVESGATATINFSSPLAILPQAGDQVAFYTSFSLLAPYQLPVAGTNVLGGVKIPANSGLNITSDGSLSVVYQYVLPPASPTVLGGIMVGNTMTANSNGVLNAKVATGSAPGIVKPSSGLIIAGDGTLTVDTSTLPAATSSLLGLVKIGSNINVTVDGVISVAAPYTLPAATTSTRGGVRVGGGLNITSDVISLAPPTGGLIGGVKAGTNITIAADGTISSNSGYTLPIASQVSLGGVIIGDNITIDGTGKISVAAPFTLPTATSTVLGGVKIGSGVNVALDGTISVTSAAIATASTVGLVKPGTTLTVAGDGSLDMKAATASVIGGVKPGTGLAVTGDGTLNVTTSGYTLPVATTTVLGGVKQGSGVTIAGDGTLSLNAQPYDIPMYYKGIPPAGTIMGRITVVRTVTLPVGLTGSLATAEVAATAQTVLRIVQNTTDIGTVTFAAASKTGTFTFASQVVLTAGDILYLYNAAAADATLSDISTTLVGTR